MNISPYRLAVDLGVSPWVSPPTVNDIVHEKRGITPEMAIRLAKYFGNSEQFWLNLQDAFAVYHARKKYSKELKAIKALAAGTATRQDGYSRSQDVELLQSVHPWADGTEPQFM